MSYGVAYKFRQVSRQNLRQHVGQDAAGAVVVFFHGGIDADYDR